MKILNLVDPNKSDIIYKLSRFPDGQQNIVIDLNSISYRSYYIKVEKSGGSGYEARIIPVQIRSRLNNFRDLELIICAAASLRELGVEDIHLYVPYIMGARSDRKFEEGGNNYLKDVICPIINSLKFKTVTCIDPHSDVLEACIYGFRKESNKKLLGLAISEIYKHPYGAHNHYDKMILVSPDVGASKKIFKLAEQIGYKGNIITCSKDRDVNGKLTRTVVPFTYKDVEDKDFVIIDDICDGGRTFINIADTIKQNGLTKNKIYLVVTHGIFSAGFEELSKYFDGIYCTNSYSDVAELTTVGLNKAAPTKVKQLNVF